jgi:3-oxoacyl-[acyl-carrier-protein] synthase II
VAERRVVVTGLGLLAPVGNTVAESWENVKHGVSGIRAIDSWDVSGFTTRFAGAVRNFDVGDYMEPKEARKCDPFIHYGIAASQQAIADSGIVVNDSNAHRIGVAMGAGIGGIQTIESNYDKWRTSGPRRISPFFVPATIINMISGHVSIINGMRGPNIAVVTACTTSTHCIGLAARLIQCGDADVMFAGGSEYATTPMGLGGFCAARALSTRNDEPERASRPWDMERDGFVLSDGAGCLALEEYEHARARGAQIYAEFAGFGMSADAYHITAPAEGGDGAKQCMVNALDDARLNPEDVGYINAHGTSTPLGDIAETLAIRAAFGEAAKRIAVSSTKSTTGHMIGAAGAAEAIFSILAMRDGVIPPTINLEDQDPQCDLDYTANEARDLAVNAIFSNSFGFGGTNGTVAFKKLT